MEIYTNPLFGILLTILFYEFSLSICKKINKPLANPLLISVTLIILFLKTFNLSYENYMIGGNHIHLFLGPATVVLAYPLYKQRSLLKKHLIPILLATTLGSITSVTSIIFLSKIMGLDQSIMKALIPHSVTTPIGIDLAQTLLVDSSITVASIVFTGLLGAIFSPVLIKVLRIKNPIAQGIAIGTSSHALGTSKAIQLGNLQGAMSSLAIGLAGIITIIITPIIMLIFL